jgi:hypothetical protein
MAANADWDAFQVEAFKKTAQNQRMSANPLKLSYADWIKLNVITPFVADFKARFQSNIAPRGRIEGYWHVIKHFMYANGGSAQMHIEFVKMDTDCTVPGVIYQDGILIPGVLKFKQGSTV